MSERNPDSGPATALPDEYPRPSIEKVCKGCHVTWHDVGTGKVIVSPRRVAHFGEAGSTACGTDATGDHWWWPL